jgi:spore coat protein A
MKTMRYLHSGLILLTALGIMAVGTVNASTLVPQTELPGDCIPKFAVPMPVFGPAGPIPRVNALIHHKLTVTMQEIGQQVLPTDTSLYPSTYIDPWTRTIQNCPSVDPQKTSVWAYGITDTLTGALLAPANWPGVTIETKRHVPTTITYVNQLPAFKEGGLVQGLISIDKTIHWADPLHVGKMNPCMDNPDNTEDVCSEPYGFLEGETPPAVPHLHGAEDSSTVDGGPDAWFTPDGIQGTGYSTLYNAGPGTAVYRYLNDQEPGTLWFHDHALGATRTNVYSGLEAFYFIRDKESEPKGLPEGPYDIEMAIQTRQFDTDGQLFFPDGSSALCGTESAGDPCLNGPPGNPGIHPFWIPEFIGDVMTVNGAPWPVLNVEPRRYRFRLLDGANARFYNMTFGNARVYAVGADDNYLDKPKKIRHVFLAPGERIEVIVDFSKLAGQTIDVTNDAPVPYPDGLIPGVDQPGMAKVMRFRVGTTLSAPDHSCDPARHQCRRPHAMVRLTDGKGHLAPGVKIDRVRQLVLKEFANPTDDNPVVVLVNNTYWDGERSPSINADFPAEGISERPRVGSTELWEIINLTGDAHPMHTHLTQFQILNRESYDTDGTMGSGIPGGYFGAWSADFGYPNNLKCATFSGDPDNPCPGYGPPLDYLTPNSDGAIGGNPAISPYLLGDAEPPAPWESGWKDTAKAMPGQVLRLVIRWTPSSVKVIPNKSYAGRNFYSFDPTEGPGYVWHCHIIDHEDNEMMRPYKVTK